MIHGGKLLLFLVAGMFFSVVSLAQEKIVAFPGAEGAGKYTVGGRHGTVYRVTNLNPSGPGSLADAVSQPNRIIVFAVSGIIDLGDKNSKKPKHSQSIRVSQPHITIAGQTAPGEGICLKGGSLEVSASDVIVRFLRSRRGFVVDGNMGDAFTAKPGKTGVQAAPINEKADDFERRKLKKLSRGRDIYEHGHIENIIFDHLSASWATDENLSVTHPNNTTVQYCIAAEGLDYANPNQTPPNHSEGSLWGVWAAKGQSTMHHMLYAHNRLRSPRLTSGEEPAAILDFRNNVVYDPSEYSSHTGHGGIQANWVNNYYKYGPSTPAELRGEMFRFEHNSNSRFYASGNFIYGFPESTQNNWLAIRFGKTLSREDEKTMRVDQPFAAIAVPTQTALEAFETVMNEAGATLPARDPVDLRLMDEVRNSLGHVIEKETDLSADYRWPDYHSLPAPIDSDGDGIPDYWEEQFGLDSHNPADSMQITAGGYANIEHYFNNTDPQGGTDSLGGAMPIVFVSTPVSRSWMDGLAFSLGHTVRATQPGVWRITRTGNLAAPLVVHFHVEGSAVAGQDYVPLADSVTIPAGSAAINVLVLPEPNNNRTDEKTVVLQLNPDEKHYHLGCPCNTLVVILAAGPHPPHP